MKTVPDMELECRLFTEKLASQNGTTREELYQTIEEWVQKVRTWNSGPDEDAWVTQCSVAVATHCQVLLPLLNKKYELKGKLQHAESSRKKDEDGVCNAYDTMLQRLNGLLGNPESDDALEFRRKSLLKWKNEKLEGIHKAISLIQNELSELEMQLHQHMDKFIGAAQKANQAEPEANAVVDDPMMNELESLMANCFSAKPPVEPAAKLDSQQTLILGATPTPSEAAANELLMMDSQPVPDPTLPPDQDTPMEVDEGMKQLQGGAPTKEVEATEAKPSADQDALQLIDSLESGPLKSALLALHKSTTAKAGYITQSSAPKMTYVVVPD